MKNLSLLLAVLLLVLASVEPSHAIFGQKQARFEAEKQAAQAKADLQSARQKAEADQQSSQWKIAVLSVLLVGSLVYALARHKAGRPWMQQVINFHGPVHQVVTNSFVIDGANVIRYGNNEPPSLLRLLGVIIELHRKKCACKCYFDANTFYKLKEWGLEGQATTYRELLKKYPAVFVEVPGGTKADDFILDYAHQHGTPIISNDRYRDYAVKYAWIAEASNRRISFVAHPNTVQLSSLGIEATIPAGIDSALDDLAFEFATPAVTKA